MSDEPNATDAAVKLAEEQGLDLADVLGSGADGRITKGDVESHLAAQDAPKPETADESDDEPADDGLLAAAAALLADEPDDAAPFPADERTAAIAALPNLQAIIAWKGDREQYGAALRARANELLGKA